MATLQGNVDTVVNTTVPNTVANALSALGNASTHDVGTGANQLVKLDASGNLPAVGVGALQGVGGLEDNGRPFKINAYTGQWMNSMSADGGGHATHSGYGSNGGTHNWAKDGSAKLIHVQLIAGGGGGSGQGETGGSGGFSEEWMAASNVGSNINVTWGNGGGHSHYSGCASRGGTSSFGGHVAAEGGLGANCWHQHKGSHGGHGNNGNITMFGGAGNGHTGGESHSTPGGIGVYGGWSGGGHNNDGPGWHHGAPGAGGGTHSQHRGNNACSGMVLVMQYK
jgi:hypothetical protein